MRTHFSLPNAFDLQFGRNLPEIFPLMDLLLWNYIQTRRWLTLMTRTSNIGIQNLILSRITQMQLGIDNPTPTKCWYRVCAWELEAEKENVTLAS